MQKPPSWKRIRSDAAAFAARWADETDENASSQTFWNEFLQIFSVDRKRVATFEARAQRSSTGGRGRIDLFWPGVLVAEQKSAGKDLAVAEDQAIDYLEAIGSEAFPGHVITSDFARMRIRDLGGDNIPFEFPLTDLVKEIDRFGFIAGYNTRRLTHEQAHKVDVAAAQLMASLYVQLAATGMDDHEISVLLIRILFLMFGDDTGMWEKGLFLEYLETRTQADGSDLGPQVIYLFQTLDKPIEKRPASLDDILQRFPYVNGGLFADRLLIPSLTGEMRTTLIECSLIDWGAIVPAIFGSLFQAVKSKEARRSLGEHYTTEKNILRLIGPLFLDDLNAKVDRAWHDAKTLKKIRTELGQMRFLDPACGCGNFLIIGYREMRRLELRIMRRLRELTGEDQLSLDATLGLQVSPAQFHGIEVEEWPARIAETAMFLVDHQMNLELAREFGEAPDRLPISTGADIRIGNAIRMDWRDVLPSNDNTYVMGNPPFIGMSRLTPEQQEDNRIAFERLGGAGKRTGRLDYVACWYAKTIEYLNGTKGRAGLVSTNSITQGDQARALGAVLKSSGFEVDFGHRSFKWESEAPGAAAVHVVIIGFSPEGQAKTKRLFHYKDVKSDPTESNPDVISFHLSDGETFAPAKRSQPIVPGLPVMTQGSKPWDGGNLFFDRTEFLKASQDLTVDKYLHRFIGAQEMLNSGDRWCLWLKDAPAADLRSSPLIRERLQQVRESRLKSPTASTRELANSPGVFAQDRQPTVPYLAVPKVSSETREYIPAAFFDASVIAGDAVLVVPECPIWLFGYLQSRAFMSWVKAFSGRLESRYQLLPGLIYYAFPFIQPEGKELEAVDAAAQRVLDARAAHPESSLADLYDPLAMPKNLRDAHRALDKSILGLYGLKADATEAEILAALIAWYKELEAANQLPMPTPQKATRAPRTVKAPSKTAQIRVWAAANGYTVPARGRLPKDITTAWERAQSLQASQS